MSGGEQEAATSSATSNFETCQLPNFYPPNNNTDAKEDFEITHREFEQIKDALKHEQFRKLLVEYVEDIQVTYTRNSCVDKK